MQSMPILTSNLPPPNTPPANGSMNEPSGSGEFSKMLARDLASRKQQHDTDTKNQNSAAKAPDTAAKNSSSGTKSAESTSKSSPSDDKSSDTEKKASDTTTTPLKDDDGATPQPLNQDATTISLKGDNGATPQSLNQDASALLLKLQSPTNQDPAANALLTQSSGIQTGEIAAGLLQRLGQEISSRSANGSINPIQTGNTPRHTPLQSLQESARSAVGTGRPETEIGKTVNLAADEKFMPVVSTTDKTAHSFAQALTQELITPSSSNPSGPTSGFSSLNSISSATPNAPPSEQTLRLDPRVGTPAWDGALAQKVTWMSNQQMQVAQLHLNPPDLGPMEVTLTVGTGPDAETRIDFTSPHLAVREAIQSALPQLREMMEGSGISLGSTTVSAESFQQQSNSGRQDNPLNGSSNTPSQIGSEISSGSVRIRTHEGMVDTFA